MIGSTSSIPTDSSSSAFASCVAPQMLASVEYAFSLGSRYGRPRASEELAHLGPPAELADEVLIEPRLVDPQRRVDEQPVAVEALDVVALVRAAVAPDVDAVVVHRPHEERAGHGPPERRRVEVRPAGGGDVEGAALQGHQALAHQLGSAVDDAGRLGPVLPGAARHAVEVRFVVLAEISGVGVRDGAALAHPGHRRRRVEAAGEGDADPLADRQRRQDVGHGRRADAVPAGEGRHRDRRAQARAIASSTRPRRRTRPRSPTAMADADGAGQRARTTAGGGRCSGWRRSSPPERRTARG